VNYQLMYEAAARAGRPADNKIIYWPKLLDWTNQTLTPNPDVIRVRQADSAVPACPERQFTADSLG
jgi:hypothetical protein